MKTRSILLVMLMAVAVCVTGAGIGAADEVNQMNAWRMDRIRCDYDLNVEVAEEMCKSAISDAAMIVNTCNNLVEEF